MVSLRCLIVDDNPGFRAQLRALLQEQGIDVVGDAASGLEACAQIAELRPDVALIDIDLGGESGLTLARRLRQRVSRSERPDVIMISAHAESEYADLIEPGSAVGFLPKTDLSATTIRRLLAAADESRPGGKSRSDGRRGT
jgi:DNA-binding NarL/FixJ family response regulator